MLYKDDIRAYDPVLCFISSNSQFPYVNGNPLSFSSQIQRELYDDNH